MESEKTLPDSRLPRQSSRPQPSRRRVLKGALGSLPAVYTLPSSAQTAMGSFACMNEQSTTGEQGITATEDTWTSQRVYTGTANGRTVYCVPDASTFGQTADACVDGGAFGTKASPDSRWIYEDGSPVESSTVVPTGQREFSVARNQQYGLVYVDESGRFKPFYDPNGQLTQAQAGPSASCLASFNMATSQG